MSDLKTYGLIGFPLGHSFSPKYFQEKFTSEGIENAQYLSYPLESIEDFSSLIRTYNLSGLNVTIPYKQSIIPFLDDLSEVARAVNAVNCITFENDRIIGHNTDVIGFERTLLDNLGIRSTKALILGTGGAAQAVSYVLKSLGIAYHFVSRQQNSAFYSYEKALTHLHDHHLIINTSPVGMSPNSDACPLASLEGIGPHHLVYDLIYNPEKTSLLLQAESLGAQIKNGREMLEIQAEESWKLWNKV